MSDEEIEATVRGLIEQNILAEDTREAALDWLDKRVTAYQAMQDLGLIDEEDDD